QVFPAFARLMSSEQLLHLPNRAAAQRFRRQAHVGGIQVPFRFGTGAVDSEDHYRRTEDDDEDEDEDEGAECGEGRLAPTPTPQPCGWPNTTAEDRFVLEKTAQFVGKLFRGRVAAGRFFLEAFQGDGLA